MSTEQKNINFGDSSTAQITSFNELTSWLAAQKYGADMNIILKENNQKMSACYLIQPSCKTRKTIVVYIFDSITKEVEAILNHDDTEERFLSVVKDFEFFDEKAA